MKKGQTGVLRRLQSLEEFKELVGSLKTDETKSSRSVNIALSFGGTSSTGIAVTENKSLLNEFIENWQQIQNTKI